MALPDLLQWLSHCIKTGCLSLSGGRFRKEILFRDGVIVASSSNDPREYLGQFLLSHHKISEEQLRMAMETQRSTGVMLGKILVMLKAIDEQELRGMLVRKAEESIFSLFLWSGGSFEFEDKPVETKNLFPLHLKVEDVLLEGLTRYDELQVIRRAFSPGEFVVERTRKTVPPTLAADPEVRRLLEVVNGRRSLTDICLEMHASEFKVSRIAYDLYTRGYLAVATQSAEHDGPPDGEAHDDLVALAASLLEQQKAGEALELLEPALRRRPTDLALRSLMDAAEAQFVERAYRHYLPPSHIPVLQKPLESLTDESLTPQEVFLVSRINGTWSVKDVITISPIREVEALRTLKHLRERGVIGLRSP